MAISLFSSLKLLGGLATASVGVCGGWYFYKKGIGGYGGWGSKNVPPENGRVEEDQPAPERRVPEQQAPQPNEKNQPNQKPAADSEERDQPPQEPLQQNAQQPPGDEAPQGQLGVGNVGDGSNHGRKPPQVDSKGECEFKDNNHKENFSFLVHELRENTGKLENLKNLDSNDARPIKDAIKKTKDDMEDNYYTGKLNIDKDAWEGMIDLLEKIINKGSALDNSGYYGRFNSDIEKIKKKFVYTLEPQAVPLG